MAEILDLLLMAALVLGGHLAGCTLSRMAALNPRIMSPRFDNAGGHDFDYASWMLG